jgi:hypothetical protein
MIYAKIKRGKDYGYEVETCDIKPGSPFARKIQGPIFTDKQEAMQFIEQQGYQLVKSWELTESLEEVRRDYSTYLYTDSSYKCTYDL